MIEFESRHCLYITLPIISMSKFVCTFSRVLIKSRCHSAVFALISPTLRYICNAADTLKAKYRPLPLLDLYVWTCMRKYMVEKGTT
jgi:hypothetical protein